METTMGLAYVCAAFTVVYFIIVGLCLWGWHRFMRILDDEPKPPAAGAPPTTHA